MPSALPNTETQVLKSPTVIGNLNNSPFNFLQFLFLILQPLLFDAVSLSYWCCNKLPLT